MEAWECSLLQRFNCVKLVIFDAMIFHYGEEITVQIMHKLGFVVINKIYIINYYDNLLTGKSNTNKFFLASPTEQGHFRHPVYTDHPLQREGHFMHPVYSNHPLQREGHSRHPVYTDHPLQREGHSRLPVYANHPLLSEGHSRLPVYANHPLLREGHSRLPV